MKLAAALLIFAVLAAGCTTNSINQVILLGSSGQKIVDVEIADDSQEWQQGLMDRAFLAEDQGMLFVFPQSSVQRFWMKNTLIPLDMLFISDSFEVVDITTMQPCKAEPCPAYSSKVEAKYVLEVNAGYSQANNITIGSKVAFHFASSS